MLDGVMMPRLACLCMQGSGGQPPPPGNSPRARQASRTQSFTQPPGQHSGHAQADAPSRWAAPASDASTQYQAPHASYPQQQQQDPVPSQGPPAGSGYQPPSQSWAAADPSRGQRGQLSNQAPLAVAAGAAHDSAPQPGLYGQMPAQQGYPSQAPPGHQAGYVPQGTLQQALPQQHYNGNTTYGAPPSGHMQQWQTGNNQATPQGYPQGHGYSVEQGYKQEQGHATAIPQPQVEANSQTAQWDGSAYQPQAQVFQTGGYGASAQATAQYEGPSNPSVSAQAREGQWDGYRGETWAPAQGPKAEPGRGDNRPVPSYAGSGPQYPSGAPGQYGGWSQTQEGAPQQVGHPAIRFGSTTKVPARRVLKYYIIS